jgi:hypothetical protein
LITELFIQVFSVDNIPVVGQGNRIGTCANDDRLDITYPTGTSCRITIMANGDIPGELTQGLLTEYLGHQAHISTEVDVFAIGGSNTGTLLATMLESK